MFMLIPSQSIEGCYNMGLIDAASDGSTKQLMVNIWESASVLDTWETALPKSVTELKKYGLDVDTAEAEEKVKHFYQTMRHGMSFDWMLNYVCGRFLDAYPYYRAFKFSGTDSFVNSFADDGVFTSELAEIDNELQSVLDWVFEGYPDRLVYRRLRDVNAASVENAIYALKTLPTLGDGSPYVIPVNTAYRVNYLALLMEMFSQGIGWAKRSYWSDMIESIRTGTSDGIIVVGNKFEAFAYGDIGQGIQWNRMENGIQMLNYSERQQEAEYVKAFPDEGTLFRFMNSTLFVDETLFPQVSFDNGETWLTTNQFKETGGGVEVDKPLRMKVKYPFAPKAEDVGKKTIKLVGSLNCVIKDAKLILDENNEAETQIVFRSAKVSFKVTDVEHKYPSTFFKTSAVSIASLEWL